MARYALERIPSPAADEALRQALAKVKGQLLIGTINSLGNRKSPGAVSDLARLLSATEPAVAGAAAAALGKIGSVSASALEQALSSAPTKVQRTVVEACLLSAEALLAEGQRDRAIALYDRIRQGRVPPSCLLAAMRGAILARQKAGTALLVELLTGNDPALFGLALSLIRYHTEPEFTHAATGELGKLSLEKQVRLIEALADRGDKVAVPALVQLTREGHPAVRPAAVRALGQLGNASLAPALLGMASASDKELARAALSSLATLTDKDVDVLLLAALAKNDQKVRIAAIEVLGQRRTAAATPFLLQAAVVAVEPVRRAALRALAGTAGPQDVEALVQLVLRARDPGELAAVQATVRAACMRMPDREACARQLDAGLARASGGACLALLHLLGQVGGARALETLKSAVKKGEPSVRDAALHILSEWQDVTAAPELLALARTSDNRTHKVLALRGYIRLIGQRDLPPDRKLVMCREALPLIERPEEKQLLLGALGGVHSAGGLALVAPYLDDPVLNEEASAAAVAIGERLAGSQPAQVSQLMKKVLAVVHNQDIRHRAQEVLQKTEKK